MKVENNKAKVLKELNNKNEEILTAIGLHWQGKVTQLVENFHDKPIVDTGRYKAGYTFVTDDDKMFLGNTVDYASFIEFGTNKVKARPILKPSIEIYKSQYQEIAENVLKKG